MNKKIFLAILSVVLFLPILASAQATTINGLLSAIAYNIVWIVFCAIIVFCFITAGVLFMTSNGEPAKLTKARSSLIWGIVGVIVGIIAYSVVTILSHML